MFRLLRSPQPKWTNLTCSSLDSHPNGRETPMKNFFRGIVFAIIALALGGWLYLRFGFADICANVPVSRFDSEIASTALHASAERHMPKEKNPIQPTDANLFDGARLYRDKCAD